MKVYFRLHHNENIHENLMEVRDISMALLLEKFKYQTMWALRSIEDEMNKEGGMVIISKDGYETRGFSEYLENKIIMLINSNLKNLFPCPGQ